MLCGQNVEFVVVLQVTTLLSSVNQGSGSGSYERGNEITTFAKTKEIVGHLRGSQFLQNIATA